MYPNVELHIGGAWRGASGGGTLPVLNPATAEPIGTHPVASREDLDAALEAAKRGFKAWKATSVYDRYKIMRKAADLLRERAETIARIMTLEQGKPLPEAKMEVLGGADTIDWFAEEGRRAYGRVIPGRAEGVMQIVIREPVGPVAAFTPWNFPINQAVRKVSGALAAGCSVILKGPEDTPASCMELVRAFLDAGVPGGVIGLVFGHPAEISEYLIAASGDPQGHLHRLDAGRQAARRARRPAHEAGHDGARRPRPGDRLRGCRPRQGDEAALGGEVPQCRPGLRLADPLPRPRDDLRRASSTASSPTRRTLKVGDGMDPKTRMGPLAHARRIEAMEGFVADAVAKGAKLRTGGKRIGNQGFFFEPTVLTDVPLDARIMNEEPFGPIAAINRFADDEEAFEEANRLPFGLAAYAYTRSAETQTKLAARVESGMISINHHGLALPEVPFGGVKDSGYGSEGGAEAIEGYLNTKFVTQVGA